MEETAKEWRRDIKQMKEEVEEDIKEKMMQENDEGGNRRIEKGI